MSAKFRHETTDISLEVIPVAALTRKDKKELHELFFAAFKLHGDNSRSRQQQYLNYAFTTKPGTDSFIHLYKVDGKIVSFKTFDIEHSTHPETGGAFTLYHGKLAAVNPRYAGLGLTELSFLSMICLAKSYSNLLGFIKAIHPGYATCILPEGIEFFPKLHLSSSLVEHIGEVVEDRIHGKAIPAKLTVLDGRLPKQTNIPLMWFNHVIPTSDQAMAMIFPVNADCKKRFKEVFTGYGIDDRVLTELEFFWQEVTCPAKTSTFSPEQ